MFEKMEHSMGIELNLQQNSIEDPLTSPNAIGFRLRRIKCAFNEVLNSSPRLFAATHTVQDYDTQNLKSFNILSFGGCCLKHFFERTDGVVKCDAMSHAKFTVCMITQTTTALKGADIQYVLRTSLLTSQE
jgi:hypothetical protein